MYKYMYILAQINSEYKYEAFNYVKSAYLYAGGNYPNSPIGNRKALQNARLVQCGSPYRRKMQL